MRFGPKYLWCFVGHFHELSRADLHPGFAANLIASRLTLPKRIDIRLRTGLRQQPMPQNQPRSTTNWQRLASAEVNEGSAGSREFKLHDMVEIDDRSPVDAKEAFGVQALTKILHRHSMFIGGIQQVQPNQVAMALNPDHFAHANEDDTVSCPDAHPIHVLRGRRCGTSRCGDDCMDSVGGFEGFFGLEQRGPGARPGGFFLIGMRRLPSRGAHINAAFYGQRSLDRTRKSGRLDGHGIC